MGTKSKSDISNSAIRIFFQEAGVFYDEARGFKRFSTTSTEWKEVLKLFSNSCCYCGVALETKDVTNDHLIPINKTSLGLHAWGNVVPCCQNCNKEKNSSDWKNFLLKKSPKSVYKERLSNITKFQKRYKYNPNLGLKEVADNLYQDVGEVSSVLIKLRLKQAESVISDLVSK